MIGYFRKALDSFRGGGQASITVPPMDGALRSNNDIEEGEAILSIPSADNLAVDGAFAAFSSGGQVLVLEKDNGTRIVADYDARVSALAVKGEVIAVGLASGGIVLVGGSRNGTRFMPTGQFPINCPTALSFVDDDTLLVANGSSVCGPDLWKTDLMSLNVKGSVWSVDLRTGAARRLADGLAWPNGVLALADGRILVSEAWRYRLIAINANGAIETVLPDLPGYPGRLAKAGNGYWLPLFAPRRRLVELVLREPAYRKRMMAEIPSEYWVSPSIRPMSSFLEPLQGGTLKKLARLKPWAPSRSYGLIVRLDSEFQAIASFHSRADGTRHGISSCAMWGDRLLAASTGGDALVSIDPKGF